eukprot:CFRG7467T1
MAYYAAPGYAPPVPQRGGTTRQQQVGWLKQEFGGFLIEKQPDAIYEIPVQSTRFNGYFRVTLPQGFPETQPPYFQVFPSIRHEWVDANGYVTGHPKLYEWSPYYKTSEILQDIIRHLSGDAQQPVYRQPSHGVKPSTFSPPPRSPTTAKPAYPGLKYMTATELEELLDDELKLNDFIVSLPQIKNSREIAAQTRAANKILAEKNLARQPELEAKNAELQAKRAELSDAKSEYLKVEKELEVISQKYDPRTILEQIRVSAAEKDEETEDMANSFLDGEMDIKDFIKKFKQERVIFHLRAAKAERLEERLNEEKNL